MIFLIFFPSFPTRSVRKSCFLPEIQSICRAKCRATSEQIPAVEVVMVMCFEDALSDDSMMKLDWNYLGWAAMFPTSFAGSSLNCAERASVKILKVSVSTDTEALIKFIVSDQIITHR